VYGSDIHGSVGPATFARKSETQANHAARRFAARDPYPVRTSQTRSGMRTSQTRLLVPLRSTSVLGSAALRLVRQAVAFAPAAEDD
jgi:hypothetical protein